MAHPDDSGPSRGHNRGVANDRSIRASDADRRQGIADLHKHAAAGRLDAAELNARVAAVQQARTLADIDGVFADLPPDPVASASSYNSWNGGPAAWAMWAGISLICWAVWLVQVVTSKDHQLDGLWPLWVTVPWGAVIFASSLTRRSSRRRS